MGCSESKLDSLPAVSLCRDRCKFLDHALRHLHALSKSHVAYTRSLYSTGASLRLFFDRHLDNTSGPPPPPPPPPRPTTTTTTTNAFTKTPTPAAVTAAAAPPSASSSSRSSDSHIKFDSDSDTDDNPGRAPAEFHQIDYNYEEYYKSESFNVFFDKFTSINYMKRQPALATTYTRQIHDNNYEVGRFLQSNDDPPPPPPPPAPSESAWDFSNFFEPYELQPHGSRRRDPERLQIQGKEERAVVREENGERRVAAGNGEDEVKKEEKERYGDNGRKAVREVEALFQKAAESGDEVLKLINDDVSGVRYCRVNGVNAGQWFFFVNGGQD